MVKSHLSQLPEIQREEEMKPKKSLRQEMKEQPIEVRKDVFRAVADDDMPNGAYFAMAEEFGLEPTDLVDD